MISGSVKKGVLFNKSFFDKNVSKANFYIYPYIRDNVKKWAQFYAMPVGQYLCKINFVPSKPCKCTIISKIHGRWNSNAQYALNFQWLPLSQTIFFHVLIRGTVKYI